MSRGNGTIVTPDSHEKPKTLFEAIAHIERYAFAHSGGTDVSDKYITMKDRLDYFSLGLRSQLMGAFFTILLAPISMGVIQNYIPIFGLTSEPDIIAKVYAYILSYGLSLGFAIFFAFVGKFYVGQATKVIIFNLFMGSTVGAVIKMLVGTLLYGCMYFLVLTESNILGFLDFLNNYNIPSYALDKVYHVLICMRSVMIPTAYLVLFSTAVFIVIPWVSVVYTSYKQRTKEI